MKARGALIAIAVVFGMANGLAAETRETTLPAGTLLRVRLDSPVASDTSRVEDPVRARLASPVTIGGRTVVPAGSTVTGVVTQARRAGKVKGRGQLALRFSSLAPSGSSERYRIRTNTWSRIARSTQKRDAAKIGIPAAGGAIIGGVVGGKKGAAIGATAAGAGGTAVVLSTRGEDVRLGRGAVVLVRLAEPVTLR
jgi:hypothetical protein